MPGTDRALVTVRRATLADADAVARVFTRSFRTLDFLPRLHTAEEDRGFIRDVVLAEREAWVADDGGRIAGFAALAGDVLTHLYVDPDAQGRGVGSALLERVKGERPAGFELWVFQRNDRARRFYERHGCRLVRLTDGSGNEERTPDALYAWQPEG